MKNQGVFGLFQGHSATLLRIFPYAAIKFMLYEQLKSKLMPTPQDETHIKKFLAGSLAGCMSVFFTYPLDILRVRLAMDVKAGTRTSLLSTARILYSEPSWLGPQGGLTNFYKGFLPTLYGMIPYAGVSFLTYESLKSFALTHYQEYTLVKQKDFSQLATKEEQHHPHKPQLKAWSTLVCGALSGILAQTSSYPLEVIRRVMQVSGSKDGLIAYENTFKTAKGIYQRKGFRGFWVGLSIGYVKVTPMFAISFYTYEFMKKQLSMQD
jgi:solute carrier family 25 protein 16